MEDDIDMANHSITNLKDPQPSDASHAASVNYVTGAILNSNFTIIGAINDKIKESEEKSIQAVNQENVFKKVMMMMSSKKMMMIFIKLESRIKTFIQ